MLFLACNCDVTGSTSLVCNKTNGQCQCKTNVSGLQCRVCQDGFKNHPNCTSNSVCDILFHFCLYCLYFKVVIAILMDQMALVVQMKDNVYARSISEECNVIIARISILGSLHVNSANVMKKVVYTTSVTSLQVDAPVFQM